MQFASLGSGSKGNATLVVSGLSRVLVDCGFSLRETRHRLSLLGCAAEDLSAILVTHEHGDHIAGVSALARRYDIPVYATHGTLRSRRLDDVPRRTAITACRSFTIDGLTIRPYTVPHDARETCQFCFESNGLRLGMLTDAGHVTPHMVQTLGTLDALILETNHDQVMLRDGPYHGALKRRVGGDYGHLSNDQAAGLVAALDCSRLRYLVAAHLSEQNNTVAAALGALTTALGGDSGRIRLSSQDGGPGWLELD